MDGRPGPGLDVRHHGPAKQAGRSLAGGVHAGHRAPPAEGGAAPSRPSCWRRPRGDPRRRRARRSSRPAAGRHGGHRAAAITNQASLIAALDAAFESVKTPVDLSDLPGRIAAAKPDAFVEVVTLRREAYDQIRGQIRDLPGTVFREAHPAAGAQPRPSPGPCSARSATCRGADREEPGQVPGRRADRPVRAAGAVRRLLCAASPGVQIVIPQPRRDDGTGDADLIVFRSEPKAGQSLKTTLDQKVQNAADAALVGYPQRSALVAIRVSDGPSWPRPTARTAAALNLAFTAQRAARLDVQDGHRARPARQRPGEPGHPGELPQDVHCGRSLVQQREQLRARCGAVPHRLRQVVQHRVRLAGAEAGRGRAEEGRRLGRRRHHLERRARTRSPDRCRRTRPMWRPPPPRSARARRWSARSAWARRGRRRGARAPGSRRSCSPTLPTGAPRHAGPGGDPPADGTELKPESVAALPAMMREAVTARYRDRAGRRAGRSPCR